jgi:long-chain acyl-CoA synthetase
MFHAIGQNTIMLPLFLVGGLLHLQTGRFDPDAVLDQVQDEQVTTLVGVPTFYRALLAAQQNRARDLTSLRVVVSGGAPLAAEVQAAVEATLEVELLQVYGLSETSPIATGTRRHQPRTPGSVGRPLWGVEVRLVAPDGQDVPAGQVGELLIRGHNVMAGYWNRPEATAAAIDSGGWFATGDLARADATGELHIVDRIKDMIIRNGFKVYPREVEDVLLEHPDVLHAAVLGVPDPAVGEQVAALAVGKPGRTLRAAALDGWLRERLPAAKRPRLVQVVDTLPTTASGKILKRAIDRAPLHAQLAAATGPTPAAAPADGTRS